MLIIINKKPGKQDVFVKHLISDSATVLEPGSQWVIMDESRISKRLLNYIANANKTNITSLCLEWKSISLKA